MYNRATTFGGMLGLADQATDELNLCRRIARGEQQLFAQIIERYRGLVAGAIASQGVGPADVEDLAQLAFISAYKGLAGFRGEAKLSSWLYRIALNTARGYLKRQARRPLSTSVEEQLEAGQPPVDEQSGRFPASELRNRELAGALARLPEAQRVTLMLFYFDELSYEEIAEALRMNLNTVRTHIRRGKLRLTELLSAEALD
jgi:RNA polymerase sigma factor (sigma-70 family)